MHYLILFVVVSWPLLSTLHLGSVGLTPGSCTHWEVLYTEVYPQWLSAYLFKISLTLHQGAIHPGPADMDTLKMESYSPFNKQLQLFF